SVALQGHAPGSGAPKSDGEPRTEFWFLAAAHLEAEHVVGLQEAMTRGEFEEVLHSGTVAQYVHRIRVKSGDAMFLPGGRLHAVGGGNILVEIQENSDTTYRVFDWNRADNSSQRQFHVVPGRKCIDCNELRR